MTIAHTPQPPNLKFEDFNGTTSKNLYNISSILSILYNLGSFQNLPKTLKNRENFGRVGVGGGGLWGLLGKPFYCSASGRV
jgi:pantothenate kinase